MWFYNTVETRSHETPQSIKVPVNTTCNTDMYCIKNGCGDVLGEFVFPINVIFSTIITVYFRGW